MKLAIAALIAFVTWMTATTVLQIAGVVTISPAAQVLVGFVLATAGFMLLIRRNRRPNKTNEG